MSYKNISEESIKSKVAADWFQKYDCTDHIKRIDFTVKIKRAANTFDFEDDYLFWAEAKQDSTDIYTMLAQLILTIKADAYERVPPKFIGCFDNEKIAFVEYHNVLPVYQLNDFNWTQTPSAVDDKTIETVRNTIDTNKIFTFYFDIDGKELRNFVKANFNLDAGTCTHSTLIDKNNFIFVYQKWLKMVMPNIDADWALLKKNYGIYDRDFFLAELNIDDNGTTEVHDDKTVNENFFVTFDAKSSKPYQIKRTDNFGMEYIIPTGFKKGGLQQYSDFWKRYKRPPQNEYWNYIVERIDLLVPQDVRERKGAFFTPQIWVEKSQQYIADVLGENWQDEYYVWDCCAGTGNLLNGLNNKYNVWASTLDQQDVDVMKERIKNGANLLENHVFQFDFLNDDFSKCPQGLQDIINNPEKRRKLVIYINPPYAEGDNRIGEGRRGVANSKIKEKYGDFMGYGKREIFIHFISRIYIEIPDCFLCVFSSLVHLQGSKFYAIRNNFKANLKKIFVVPASTFDNVSGDFPIGFQIWDCQDKENIKTSIADAYDEKGNDIGQKTIFAYEKYINDWTLEFIDDSNKKSIGTIIGVANDFQNQRTVRIEKPFKKWNHQYQWQINANNLVQSCIYLSVRHCIKADWLNDRDQFMYPNDGWKSDLKFQANCLINTLFHSQNKISSCDCINHWIPYTEFEVNAKERFESHFMSDFLAGKIKAEQPKDLFSDADATNMTTLQFTTEAQAVMAAGRELWRYYHAQSDANPNASLYDIKEYFQGRDSNGKMNAKSDDKQYTELLDNLKTALQNLANEIRPKVYEYGFLKA